MVYTTKIALHYFQRQHSQNPPAAGAPPDTLLVLQGSLAGYIDLRGSPQYTASKWAVRGLLRSLRRTSLAHGTRVNYIAPWFVNTDILTDEAVAGLTAIGVVFAEAKDAAAAVLRLVADDAVHGRALAVVPRMWGESGFVDLQLDDYEPGSRAAEMQELVLRG